ncbi:MAG: hypothetical protein GXP30_09615 [Verrucomicrobia bacterium]|nr:hypothetical protein [Verrucomicrobiota bacterium]
MKTTLELPDNLMRKIKILAAKDGRKMKDIIAESLCRDLHIATPEARPSLRDMTPVSVGRLFENEGTEDLMEDTLNERGHRY